MKASADGSKVLTTTYPKAKYGIPPHTTVAYFVSDKSSDDGVVQMYIFDNEEDRDIGKKALEKEAYPDQKLETYGDELVGLVFQAKEPNLYMEGLGKCAAE